jgi:hypothetical protein
MKSTMFAMFTLIGLAFSGSALAAPPGAEARAAEREVVQPGEGRGEVAPSTDIDLGGLCPSGYHRDGCTLGAPCVRDEENVREVPPEGDRGDVPADEASNGPRAVVIHLGPCGPGYEEVYDTVTRLWWCQPLLEEE